MPRQPNSGSFLPGNRRSVGNRGNSTPASESIKASIRLNRLNVLKAFRHSHVIEIMEQLRLAALGKAVASVTVTTDLEGNEIRVETFHPPDATAARLFMEQIVGRITASASDDEHEGEEGRKFVFVFPQPPKDAPRFVDNTAANGEHRNGDVIEFPRG